MLPQCVCVCSGCMGIFALNAALTEPASDVMLSWSDCPFLHQSRLFARRHGMRQSVCLKGCHRNGQGIPCQILPDPVGQLHNNRVHYGDSRWRHHRQHFRIARWLFLSLSLRSNHWWVFFSLFKFEHRAKCFLSLSSGKKDVLWQVEVEGWRERTGGRGGKKSKQMMVPGKRFPPLRGNSSDLNLTPTPPAPTSSQPSPISHTYSTHTYTHTYSTRQL